MSLLLLTSLAVLLRVLSNPAANVFQKTLTAGGYHPMAVNFLSYAGLSFLCLPVAAGLPWRSLTPLFWMYATLSGIAGALGNGFLVKALQKGELSVLGPINAYKSVVGMVVALLLLGEWPNLWGLAGTALIIWGSYFVLNTTAERFSWALLRREEIRFRLWALLLTAIEAVLIKKVILFSSVSIAFISWCWFGAFFSVWLLPLYGVRVARVRIARADIAFFTYLIFCLGAMQLTTNFVLNHMPVGYALALFQLSTIVSVALGYRIFKETDIRKKLLGSAIMITGSVLIILFKNV